MTEFLGNQVSQLKDLIYCAKSAVFFGGAGVSTESGIPDFRSETGLYHAQQVFGKEPEYLLSYSCFVREPELFFQYYRENLVAVDALPNAAHLALATLEEQGHLSAVVTQNVDGLHQAAGSKNVIELHGSNWRHYCVKCRHDYSLEYALAQDGIPTCDLCGGTVRPDVVMYEENLPQKQWKKAAHFIEQADLLIVGGTSLAVYPAATLVEHFHGDHLVLINKSETPADRSAHLVIHDSLGEVLGAVVAQCSDSDKGTLHSGG
ncbi:MAG: NAD-dependent protein deacylase [Propionibacteriaceae bacterium]|nr:NAD-dependent protein deacylase [Propionibacteriaceae bacterium]